MVEMHVCQYRLVGSSVAMLPDTLAKVYSAKLPTLNVISHDIRGQALLETKDVVSSPILRTSTSIANKRGNEKLISIVFESLN
jgi:hypothetical protein